MTPAVIADDFITGVVLPEADEYVRRFWEDFGTHDEDIETLVEGWDASRVAKNAVTDRRLFIETLHQLRTAIIAFENARETPERAAEVIAGEWNDWRARLMSRDEFVQQFLAEAATRRDTQGMPVYRAVLESAQAMRNRLDDLHGAAGLRDPPDDPYQMWLWDLYIRGKAASAETAKLQSMRDGKAYWSEYLLDRKTTLQCVAETLEQQRAPEPTETAGPSAVTPSFHRCDELAAHPADPDRSAAVAGVADDALDSPAALDACMAAVEAQPDEPRFAFQLGRALMLGGELDLAAGFLSDAAAGGSAAALAYLGDLEEDPGSARELYEAAASGGFAPAAALLVPAGEGADGARCDALAAHSADPARPQTAVPVADSALDPLAAFDACASAVEADPGEPRYRFQLGRALVLLGGMEADAQTHLKAASDAGYAAASAYLAGLVEDDEEALRLLRAALEGGFAPAGDALAEIEELRSQYVVMPAPSFDPRLFQRGDLLGILTGGEGIERSDRNLAYLYGFLPLFGQWCNGWPGEPAEVEAINRMIQSAYRRLETGHFTDPFSALDRSGAFLAQSKAGEDDVYKFVENYGCEGSVHDAFVAGVRNTLPPRTDTAGSRFVEGCARGKLNERQCQCLADVGSGVIPDLHNREFSREVIPGIINSNPLVGFALMGQCGIGEY